MKLLFVLLLLILIAKAWIPKILWMYWEDYEEFSSSEFLQSFYRNHQRYLQGWDVRFLTNQTVQQYLDPIPHYYGDINRLNFVKIAHKSTFIRLLLLSYYGGVYIDMSIILVENMDWLNIQNLKNNPDVNNKYGEEPDIFFFTNKKFGLNRSQFNEENNMMTYISPGYQNWFIAAKPGAQFLREYCELFHEGLLMDMYGQIKKEGKTYAQSLQAQYNISSGIPSQYLSVSVILQTLVQKKQHELDLENGQIKYAVQFYKIWHIDSRRGPLSIYLGLDVNPVPFICKYSKSFLMQKQIPIRYFIKLNARMKFFLHSYLEKPIPQSNNISQTLKIFQNLRLQKDFRKYFFPEQFVIWKGSIVHQELFKDPQPKEIVLVDGPEYLQGNFTYFTTFMNSIKSRIKNLQGQLSKKCPQININIQREEELVQSKSRIKQLEDEKDILSIQIKDKQQILTQNERTIKQLKERRQELKKENKKHRQAIQKINQDYLEQIQRLEGQIQRLWVGIIFLGFLYLLFVFIQCRKRTTTDYPRSKRISNQFLKLEKEDDRQNSQKIIDETI